MSFLRKEKNLLYPTIAGYRSMLSATFRFILPELSTSSVLKDLLRSFKIERPTVTNRTPPWDLGAVLNILRKQPYEPLESSSIRNLTKKTLFLLSLASSQYR